MGLRPLVMQHPYETVRLQRWVWVKPPIWSEHSEGANFLGKIRADESAPGGIHRKFAAKAKGISGFVMRDFAPGDPWEMGSIQVDGSGTALKHRRYGVVLKIDGSELVFLPAGDAQEALRLGQEVVKNLPGVGPIQVLQRQLLLMIRRREELQEEIDRTTEQIQIVQEQEAEEIRRRAEDNGVVAVPEPTQVVTPHSILKQRELDRPEQDLLAAINNMVDPAQRAELLGVLRAMVESVDRRDQLSNQMEAPNAGSQRSPEAAD